MRRPARVCSLYELRDGRGVPCFNQDLLTFIAGGPVEALALSHVEPLGPGQLVVVRRRDGGGECGGWGCTVQLGAG